MHVEHARFLFTFIIKSSTLTFFDLRGNKVEHGMLRLSRLSFTVKEIKVHFHPITHGMSVHCSQSRDVNLASLDLKAK